MDKPRRTRLLPKPAPYDFSREREKKSFHIERMRNARLGYGTHVICPYCYSPPINAAGAVCRCPP